MRSWPILSRRCWLLLIGLSLLFLSLILFALAEEVSDTSPRQFSIGIVSDMDQSSRADDFLWQSIFKRGILYRDADGRYSVQWTREDVLSAKIGESRRSMELSELVALHDHLYACDDRTGLGPCMRDRSHRLLTIHHCSQCTR